MPKKSSKNTRNKIVTAAWKLFYEQGYDNTTVEEIILESGTSKGSFYHYFAGKDALLNTLSSLFDDKYSELEPELPADMSIFDQLLFLNRELFTTIENTVPLELLTFLLSSQLTTNGAKHLLDKNRYYYKLLRRLIAKGLASGELNQNFGASELVKVYAMAERALLYDWCLCGGEYSLKEFSQKVFPSMIGCFIERS